MYRGVLYNTDTIEQETMFTEGGAEWNSKMSFSLQRYGITLEQMKQYFIEHQHAREIGDKKMMEKIEYHLTYINFHYECGLLATGQYDRLPEVIKNW